MRLWKRWEIGRDIRGNAPNNKTVGFITSVTAMLLTAYIEIESLFGLSIRGWSSFILLLTLLIMKWYRSHSETDLCDLVGVSFETIPSCEKQTWKLLALNREPWSWVVILEYPLKIAIQNCTI